MVELVRNLVVFVQFDLILTFQRYASCLCSYLRYDRTRIFIIQVGKVSKYIHVVFKVRS